MKPIWTPLAVVMIAAMLTSTGCQPKSDAFGEAISVNEVTKISDILSHPEDYHDKVVRLEGSVGEVCQSMACWFYLQDDTAQILIDLEMRVDSYSIPKGSQGKTAVVQGRVQFDENAPVRVIGLGNTLH
ncbi:MAG: DUF4920 domain-containing protein [Candidatus Poribacteria bacterium]|nr:DUF4920 domain-containing protein [Candidatus Poribacteria bacterium]